MIPSPENIIYSLCRVNTRWPIPWRQYKRKKVAPSSKRSRTAQSWKRRPGGLAINPESIIFFIYQEYKKLDCRRCETLSPTL